MKNPGQPRIYFIVFLLACAWSEFIESDYIDSLMSSYLEKYHLQKV